MRYTIECNGCGFRGEGRDDTHAQPDVVADDRRRLIASHAEWHEAKAALPPLTAPTGLRDLFAAHALSGLLARPGYNEYFDRFPGAALDYGEAIDDAWKLADRMLAARNPLSTTPTGACISCGGRS